MGGSEICYCIRLLRFILTSGRLCRRTKQMETSYWTPSISGHAVLLSSGTFLTGCCCSTDLSLSSAAAFISVTTTASDSTIHEERFRQRLILQYRLNHVFICNNLLLLFVTTTASDGTIHEERFRQRLILQYRLNHVFICNNLLLLFVTITESDDCVSDEIFLTEIDIVIQTLVYNLEWIHPRVCL